MSNPEQKKAPAQPAIVDYVAQGSIMKSLIEAEDKIYKDTHLREFKPSKQQTSFVSQKPTNTFPKFLTYDDNQDLKIEDPELFEKTAPQEKFEGPATLAQEIGWFKAQPLSNKLFDYKYRQSDESRHHANLCSSGWSKRSNLAAELAAKQKQINAGQPPKSAPTR
ncbi:hypothetical protein PCE1_003874 [Barthelona sp. PCE]